VPALHDWHVITEVAAKYKDQVPGTQLMQEAAEVALVADDHEPALHA